ncbi:unnamed protein product [Kuraishia capsulata CBS 1993]|uniref:Uncharacterized protein n=1 Tax=Kuraishia capsulata CBS 1993 TaxID=1382522 RepID=W6MG91_9ASCO|nr:uncharacterized protein KUCA_T00001001001 [Kuraishia capsulata CBS 1993]CDK25034.1 unnamed protein product [Kuraishia capsulata CBS 1993]
MTVTEVLELQEDQEESARILAAIKEQQDLESEIKDDEQQREFTGMSSSKKLKRLQDLVKKSQVFSAIIADTLLESTLNKKEEPRNEIKEPVTKKARRGRSATGKSHQFVPLGLSSESSLTKDKLEQASSSQKSDARGYSQPKMLKNCTLRDYQLSGMEWLITLYENGLNGILADEMGLGKTLQSIAMLAFLYEQGIKGPFLISCPLSTLSNWVDEIKRFAPSMPVLAYTGDKATRKSLRDEHFSRNEDLGIVVVSYEISILDSKYFNGVDWRFLIVDEGHRLKNADCMLIRQLKRIRTSNRLLLTGTPLQNNLRELWSLLNFILPDVFPDVQMFEQWFDFSSLQELKDDDGDDQFNELVNAEIQKSLISSLHTILKPFLLRRLKRDVVKGLPPKREYIIYGTLTDSQKMLYTAALKKELSHEISRFGFKEYLRANKIRFARGGDKSTVDSFLNSVLEGEETPTPRSLVPHWNKVKHEIDQKKTLNAIMQLRLVCDSPYLFYFPWEDETKVDAALVENSCKMTILNQLVPALIKKGHRVLIFTQFVKMLDLIHDWCATYMGYNVCRIDGSSSQEERQSEIHSFNNTDEGSESPQVFLLSTRAGGLGINLTAADSVVLFDSDWNPQVDLQAMDRVHRIGQTKPVVIYRLAVSNTVEEVLLARADSKRILEKLVIQMGQFRALTRLSSDQQKMSAGDKSSKQQLYEELDTLLRVKNFGGKHVQDNELSTEEMEELLDRNSAAYEPGRELSSKFSHITLFETVSSLE